MTDIAMPDETTLSPRLGSRDLVQSRSANARQAGLNDLDICCESRNDDDSNSYHDEVPPLKPIETIVNLSASPKSAHGIAATGRPPLPPRANGVSSTTDPQARITAGGHRETLSFSDDSYISALTADNDVDGGENGELSAANRRRGVSWDFEKSSTSVGDSDRKKRESTASENKKQSSLVTTLIPPRMDWGHDLSTTSVRKITLADIATSPLEDEATTAILQVLEQHHEEQERSFQSLPGEQTTSSSKASYLLSALPEEATHVFREDEVLESDTHQGRTTNDGTFVEHAKPSESQVLDGMKTSSHSRQSSESDDADPTHDRSATLTDIASKLRMMQVGLPSVGGSLRKSRLDATESDHVRTSSQAQQVFGSAEKLFTNARILFHERSNRYFDSNDAVEGIQGTTPETNPSGEETRRPSEAQKNWSKLRNVVKATNASPRKGSEEGCDEEMGQQEPNGIEPKNDAGEKISKFDAGREKKRRSSFLCECTLWIRCFFMQFLMLLKPKWPNICSYVKLVVFAVMVPATAVAAILFYGTNNPTLGSSDASYSWWIIFLFVRQVITFSMAQAGEMVVIDMLALRSSIVIRTLGPFLTLLIVQARGWPYTLTFWAITDFCFLYGGGEFFSHWLFYQEKIGLFNAENPGGSVVTSNFYLRLLIACIVAGVATALKRLWLATYLGRRSYVHFGPELEKIMRRMIVLSEVAHLSKEIEATTNPDAERHIRTGFGAWDFVTSKPSTDQEDDEDDTYDETITRNRLDSVASPPDVNSVPSLHSKSKPPSPPRKSGFGQSVIEAGFGSKAHCTLPVANDTSMRSTEKLKLTEVLSEWEEPEIRTGSSAKKASISDILQFRQAVSYMDDHHPFSPAFGPANTREKCVESAQKVYERLLLRTDGTGLLPFETISLLALDKNGELKREKVRALIRIFRPDRNGFLTSLDFVKSCDNVYKELRLFRAAFANSSQIDEAFEDLVNVFHYFILGIVFLTILQFDPWSLFISLSGLVLSFAFMFGKAASNYFEGLLLIFVRRPYDIGDKIAVSNPNNDTSPNGSSTWFVEGVSLFSTTVRFATTNEVATYSNGSLANSRIINSNRSPKATAYVYLKFGIDVPYDKIKIFRTVIETFVKARPREWISLNGFRATRVEADLGFIEYVVVLQHREKWQNIVPILQSKADLSSYCLEVSKKLDMRYSAPPLPVNLAMAAEVRKLVGDGIELPDLANEVESQSNSDALARILAIDELFKPEQKKTK